MEIKITGDPSKSSETSYNSSQGTNIAAKVSSSCSHSAGIHIEDIGLNKAIERLKPHDHLCLIYESKEEWRAAAVPFIAIGLKNGEKCVYIVYTSTADEIRRYLVEDGIDAASAEKSGQLAILHHTDAYTSGGIFDPDKMIALLISETEKAVSEGYPALRATGEMTWVLRGHPGSERLLEYEAKLNRDFFPKYPCLAICQYDRWKFDPEIIKGVIMTHPLIVRGGHIYRNFYYIPPEEFLSKKHAEKEIDRWLNNIAREQRLLSEIRKADERIKSVFRAAPIGMGVLLNRIILEVNDRLCEMTGYRYEELINYNTRLLYPSQEDYEYVGKEKYRQIAERGVGTVETRWLRKDGSVINVLLSSSPMDMSDPSKGVTFTALDITERKQAEEALRASEAKYRKLHERMMDCFVYVDMQGVIRDCNEDYQQMLGYSFDELSRLTYIDLTPERWHLIDQKIVDEQILPNGFSGVYEKEYRKKDGSIFPVELRTFLVKNEAGENEGMWAIVRDITERKKAEEEKAALQEQLLQSQKLEAIGKLAGGIAHDFNNILTVILGRCELSLPSLRREDPLRANLEEIKKASERAADLTRQILAFGRKQIFDLQIVDLNQILERLNMMLRRLIGEDIDLLFIPSEPLGSVKADPSQLEQVIMNLVLNARDAMPEGGTLTIETANVEFDDEYISKHIEAEQGRYVMLSVSDTGTGMTQEIRERIFEPFFTTKKVGKGTGLGLPTVYGIVKQSGGYIWVYSELGQGTTFKIYLPRVDEPVIENRGEIFEPIPQGHETILLIEDDKTVREMAAMMLQMHGYKVLEASDGSKALLLCEDYKDPIHLALTDVVMPGMSGPKLVERLKEKHPEMKALYMSGYTDNAIVHHGILEPGINFIQKPFTAGVFAKKVREVLDKV